jgi:urea transport system permease protein
MTRYLLLFLALVLSGALRPGPLWAEPSYEAALAGLVADSRGKMMSALDELAQIGDAKAVPALEALLERKLAADKEGRPVLVEPAPPRLALTGEPWTGDAAALDYPPMNNQVRGKIKLTLSLLKLSSPDKDARLDAARQIAESADEALTPLLDKALEREKDKEVKRQLELIKAQFDVKSPDPARRVAAAQLMAASGNAAYLQTLQGLLAKTAEGAFAEPDAAVREAAQGAISAMERRGMISRTARDLFFGVSLGSVLLLAALGLAITFGLMGVINMAHGEMLMLGAYATYAVQQFFLRQLPGLVEWYLIAAIPFAFGLTCLVGMILERTILKFLYGRPLETLLATWGISLALIQTVRLIFGAQNVEVRNPSWLSGGLEMSQDFMLTYNRVGIIVFVALVALLVWFVLNRTPLGLQVRAVTQDRATASAMGVYAWKVDMWTFGLGSGIAGLGGLALTQVGNVGPELGQGYIVDSFMVVVLGGVGKLAGAIVGALGLGLVNKVLEPFAGAVLGKILVLVGVILFIQKRPQGLFAFKGRTGD